MTPIDDDGLLLRAGRRATIWTVQGFVARPRSERKTVLPKVGRPRSLTIEYPERETWTAESLRAADRAGETR
jgi:hypothetical protein